MARTATTGIVFILAGLWTLWTLLVFGIALFYQFVGLDGPDGSAASILYMCSSINFIVMFILIAFWFIRKTNEDRIDEMAGYLRMYRRTPIQKIAKKMNLDVIKTEKIMLKCISTGNVKGFLDRNTDEFILEGSITDMMTNAKCPNCGGYTESVRLSGEVANCQFCGGVLPFVGSLPPPPPHIQPSPPPGGRIMICSNCRKEIPFDSNLCPYCGNDFNL